MGLDMWLYAKKFIWDEEDKELSGQLSELFKDTKLKIKVVTLEAMYWRKANAIHRWFVQNVQEGSDDCRDYEVSREDLNKLFMIIDEILKDKSKARALLPTQNGFFFGSDEYDEYYFEDLEETHKKLEELLTNKALKDFYFVYSSSW